MTYTRAKECINELGREGLEKLLKDYGEKVIKIAFRCGLSPRELQAVCRWLERGCINDGYLGVGQYLLLNRECIKGEMK